MLYQNCAARRVRRARSFRRILSTLLLLPLALAATAAPRRPQQQQQTLEREFDTPERVELLVRNRAGRVHVIASAEQKKVALRAVTAGASLTEADVRAGVEGGRVEVEVERGGTRAAAPRSVTGARAGSSPRRTPASEGKSVAVSERDRIDLTVRVPERARVRVETEAGAVDVVGNVESAEVTTDTGTIRADVPTDALKYNFQWLAARPRFYSEVELSKVKEKRGGTFEVSGRLGEKKPARETLVRLNLTTERGVILFGVSDPAQVPSDLRERALTESARAIIRSGEVQLIDAIRKVAPRLVGDYASTLPERAKAPALVARRTEGGIVTAGAEANLARFNASVTDRHGRAVAGLTTRDFTLVENGEERPIREVVPTSAPFNLVLLLDVSGSVEERLDFIRKAALAFLQTTSPQDRIAIISFRDDVQVVSEFTTDRRLLTERIKKIEAGGATALYDSLAYALVHTLRPLRGERAAVVILSDGDDNRSFIPFNSVLEATLESGALVYPLYIPSGLIPTTTTTPPPTAALDPFRTRFLTVTSRAEEEGRKLAQVSGGVFYPITRLEQLQQAYADVVTQLRMAYTITYESKAADPRTARVRLRVAREDAAVRLSPAVGLTPAP